MVIWGHASVTGKPRASGDDPSRVDALYEIAE